MVCTLLSVVTRLNHWALTCFGISHSFLASELVVSVNLVSENMNNNSRTSSTTFLLHPWVPCQIHPSHHLLYFCVYQPYHLCFHFGISILKLNETGNCLSGTVQLLAVPILFTILWEYNNCAQYSFWQIATVIWLFSVKLIVQPMAVYS